MSKTTPQGCVWTIFITDVTLSALNAPESDVDIEGDSSSSKRLDFDSGKRKLFLLLAFLFHKIITAISIYIDKKSVYDTDR